MASKSTYPLYNTTYTLHRLSPLHAFPALTTPGLKQHAKTLLSIFRGDVLRGVRIRTGDDEDESLGRAGRLKSVVWEPLVSQERWQREEDEEEGNNEPRGVVVEIIYEKATYTSLLLLPTTPSQSETGFTSLPLLLTRLPKSLRETLLKYLETTFDTLPLPLSLDSGTLKKMLEKWLDATLDEGAGKDIQLVFSAPPPGVTLKAITITIPRADVMGFFRRGERLVAAGADEGAFFEALRIYAQGTMGLDIAALSVMKVACGGFVLGVGAAGGAGKVKIFVPREGEVGERAVEGLVKGLVEASLVAALR